MNMTIFRCVVCMLGLMMLIGCAEERSAGTPGTDSPTTVVATEFSFAAPALVAEVDQPMTVVLQNDGSIEHDWTVLGLDARDVRVAVVDAHAGHTAGSDGAAPAKVHVAARAGEQNTLVFTPGRAGTYEVICTVPGHKEAGMTATLTVQS